jgi:hypothetical protein
LHENIFADSHLAQSKLLKGTMNPALKSLFIAVVLVKLPIATLAAAGSVFVTGHDPVWHSALGTSPAGAKNLAEIGIDFARNGSVEKFLFIESKTLPVPSGNAHEAPFLGSTLKYAGQYDVMNAADLAALPDFRLALDSYSAVVVASDHGGMLTAAELTFLNSRSADLIDYVNDGGGIAAFAESNAVGLIGSTPRFGFLPFLVTSSDFHAAETANTVTAFGASLGLLDSDVNGNVSHNFFSATGGLTPVDLFNGQADIPLTLAYRGPISNTGVPDGGSTALLVFSSCVALFVTRRVS